MGVDRRRTGKTGLISFGIVSILLLSLFYLQGYAPFGENALTWEDANIQYLDFFAYLKDVLEGKNNISYTFGKSLGGTNIGVFSYYLASPLNFLVVFFKKENLHIFFHLLILLKLSFAAAAFSYFLNKRFTNGKQLFVICLSVGYGLSQYSMAQCSNIMWLDGVYMLPLMLEAVYELVDRKVTWKLSVMTGLSILFNWYTGGINCLFTIFWCFFEIVLKQISIEERKLSDRLKDCWQLLWKFGFAMALGVMVSAVLFLPTIGALRGNGKGSLSLGMLFDLSFTGNIASAVQGYTLGAKSQLGSVSLFCGSLALIGTISFFFSKQIEAKKKVVFGGMLFLMLLMFYWRPLLALFSLLKSVGSYWYRYSYCGIAVLLFISAEYFSLKEFQKDPYLVLKAALGFSGVLLAFNYVNHAQDITRVYYTAILAVGIAFAVVFYSSLQKKTVHMLTVCLMFGLVLIETHFSVKWQMENYHKSDVSSYKTYVSEMQQQIREMKAYDSEAYRISQTSVRNTGSNNLMANYNESLTFNYWSVSGYTSTPDDTTLNFLNRSGYPTHGECISVVNTSILPVDSLLGVKYVLSKYPVSGMEPVSELSENCEKKVYRNPYSMPLAFTYDESGEPVEYEDENPFSYQNSLFSCLLGRETELFFPLDYDVIQYGNGSDKQPQIYRVGMPEGEFTFYGNIPTNGYMNAVLNVDENYKTAYSCWLSPTVFPIDVDAGKKESIVTVDSYSSYEVKDGEEQFYALDLQKLSQIQKQFLERRAEKIQIQNGYAFFEVKSDKKENLFISIPYDAGWTVQVNGRTISPSLIGNTFYSIPLEKGENTVKMEYKVKYLRTGAIISLIGVVTVAIVWRKEKGKVNRQRMERGL